MSITDFSGFPIAPSESSLAKAVEADDASILRLLDGPPTLEEENDIRPPANAKERNERIKSHHRDSPKNLGMAEAIHNIWQETKYAAMSGFEVAITPQDTIFGILKGESLPQIQKRMGRWRQLKALSDYYLKFGALPIASTAAMIVTNPDYYATESIIPDADDVPPEMQFPPILTADDAIFQSTLPVLALTEGGESLAFASPIPSMSLAMIDLFQNEVIYLADKYKRDPSTITLGEVSTDIMDRLNQSWFRATNPVVDWLQDQIPDEDLKFFTGPGKPVRTVAAEEVKQQVREQIQYGALNPFIWAGTAATTNLDWWADPNLVLGTVVGQAAKVGQAGAGKLGKPIGQMMRDAMLSRAVTPQAASAMRHLSELEKIPVGKLTNDQLKRAQAFRRFIKLQEEHSGLYPEDFNRILRKKAKKADPGLIKLQKKPPPQAPPPERPGPVLGLPPGIGPDDIDFGTVVPRSVVDDFTPPPVSMTGEALQPDVARRLDRIPPAVGAARPEEFLTLRQSRELRMKDLRDTYMRTERMIVEGEEPLYRHIGTAELGDQLTRGTAGSFWTRLDVSNIPPSRYTHGTPGEILRDHGPIRLVTTRQELGRRGVKITPRAETGFGKLPSRTPASQIEFEELAATVVMDLSKGRRISKRKRGIAQKKTGELTPAEKRRMITSGQGEKVSKIMERTDIPLEAILKVEVDPSVIHPNQVAHLETAQLAARERLLDTIRAFEEKGIPVVIRPLFLQRQIREYRPFVPKPGPKFRGPGAASREEEVFAKNVSKLPLTQLERQEMARRISFARQLEKQGKLSPQAQAQVDYFRDILERIKLKERIPREDLIAIRRHLSVRLGPQGPGASGAGELAEGGEFTPKPGGLFPEEQPLGEEGIIGGALGPEGKPFDLDKLLAREERRRGIAEEKTAEAIPTGLTAKQAVEKAGARPLPELKEPRVLAGREAADFPPALELTPAQNLSLLSTGSDRLDDVMNKVPLEATDKDRFLAAGQALMAEIIRIEKIPEMREVAKMYRFLFDDRTKIFEARLKRAGLGGLRE